MAKLGTLSSIGETNLLDGRLNEIVKLFMDKEDQNASALTRIRREWAPSRLINHLIDGSLRCSEDRNVMIDGIIPSGHQY